MVKCPMILLVLMVAVKAETVSNDITQLSTTHDYHDNEVHIEPSVDTSADKDELRKLKNIAENMENIIEQLHEELNKIGRIRSVKKSLIRKVSEIGLMRKTNEGEIYQLLTKKVSLERKPSMLENIKRRTRVMKNTVKWLSMFTVLVDTIKILEDGQQLPEFQEILEEIINN